MQQSVVQVPAVMPVDREAWAKQLNLSNFVNCYHQYRDITELQRARNVLIVGPGQGLDTSVLRWRGYDVTTLDIDETFHPDFVGSVHEMPQFRDKQFDVVTASHVLEHLPLPYLDTAMAEIGRVGRFALIYLPVAGRHLQLRFTPGILGIDWSFIVDIFNYVHKPDGLHARYCEGQHYWEVGMKGFRVRDVKRRLSRHFAILKAYRNRDWTPSMNFVVAAKDEP